MQMRLFEWMKHLWISSMFSLWNWISSLYSLIIKYNFHSHAKHSIELENVESERERCLFVCFVSRKMLRVAIDVAMGKCFPQSTISSHSITFLPSIFASFNYIRDVPILISLCFFIYTLHLIYINVASTLSFSTPPISSLLSLTSSIIYCSSLHIILAWILRA